eukprot:c11606_g1_i1.p1 GENE.c11606_g1_i1~~c11606_g1_i1.p1  ORF type:complete len:252 (+),score=63.26 c11606_g1_i1:454-1209(+)
MPEVMSDERKMMLLALGAEVVLTPKEEAMVGAVAKAEEILAKLGKNGYMLQQFSNPDNPRMHRDTTGPEIWRDSAGTIDAFVAGVGTGGTLSGVSQFLKSMNPNVLSIAVEPEEAAVISGNATLRAHRIQGIGAGFVPEVLDTRVIDETIKVNSDEAEMFTMRLWREEGIPCGVSSGACIAAAVRLGMRPEMAGKLIVIIVASFGERYFSHPMFRSVRQSSRSLVKQPLPEPFNNLLYGFAERRGGSIVRP